LFGCNKKPEPAPIPTDPPTVETTARTEPVTEPSTETAPETEPTLPPVEYRTDTREKTVTREERELMSVHLSVPLVDGNAAISGYYSDWLSDVEYYASLEEETAAQRYQEARQNQGVFLPYSYTSDYAVTRNDGRLFCVLREMYENTGGARPAYRVMAENFLAADGAMLVLDDLFTVPAAEYLPRIKQAVLPLMEERTAETGENPYYEGYDDFMMDVFDSRDFCLTGDGITVFWQNSALAPALAGAQSFDIPYGVLADIVHANLLP
jgi:hypothetical protein